MTYIKLGIVLAFGVYIYEATTTLGGIVATPFVFLSAGLFLAYIILRFGLKYQDTARNVFETALDGVALIFGGFALLTLIFALAPYV